MAQNFDALGALFTHGFDTLIDVRSPAEFAEDHVPGAINLPVLDDAERARVGTIYKTVSPFKARKIGAALVFRNAAGHIEATLADRPGGWRPLVYCWRGGQRSGSFVWMLREIGWRADTVQGGYKTYRRLVVQALYDRPIDLRLVQLGGYTGTAKTAVLTRLAARGVQVIDLEGLARHRGSLLGGRAEPQPSQKGFDTALAQALVSLDPARPVVVEAESSKIGEVAVPPSLWAAMKAAPWITLDAPLEARARFLASEYADILSDARQLKAKLRPLRYHRGGATLQHWYALIDAGDTVAVCRALAQDHYDPAYRKSTALRAPTVAARFETETLTPDALDAVADRIAARLQTMSI